MNYEDEKEEKIDLLEYWGVIKRRKWIIISFSCAVMLLMGIQTFTATPIYKAKSTLFIENESSKLLSMENEFGYRTQFDDLRFFNTQLIFLKSESLAERIARKLNLLSRPEFGAGKKHKKSLFAGAKHIITLKWLIPRKNSKNQESKTRSQPDPYFAIAKAVQGGIEVSPIRDTKVVEVSYTSPYPVLATEIVNTLDQEFMKFSVEKRYETTQQASDFLSEQIVGLREDLAAKEREIQRYGKEKGLFFLSDKESSAISKFADLNAAYTQAQIERIKAEAVYREIKDLGPNSLPQFVTDPTIQQLKTEYAKMRNEYQEKRKIFKPIYPEMVQLKAKLDSMKVEINKAVDSAKSEYGSALKRENSLKRLLAQQKGSVMRMNSNAILYKSLKIEVENKSKLLNTLVERQNETLVSARLGGLKTSSIGIIDTAKVPGNPVSPNKKMNFLLAIVISTLGGAGLCFLLEYLDNTVKGPEDAEKLVGLPSLGVIPFLSPNGEKKTKFFGHRYVYSYGNTEAESTDSQPEVKEIELVNHFHPKFSISEDYRTIRTSILLSQTENPPITMAFCSALPKEGKTSSAVNVAVAFAQLNKRVLLIDADLRRPCLHRIFRVRNAGGLSNYLTGNFPFEETVQMTKVENVWVIPSGPIPPNPAELLNSKRMRELIEQVKKYYDIIIVDLPPILVASEALVLSRLIDSMVIVVRPGKTAQKPFRDAVEEFKRAKAKVIGLVFNEAKVTSGSYYYTKYHRYYRYGNYGQEDQTEIGV